MPTFIRSPLAFAMQLLAFNHPLFLWIHDDEIRRGSFHNPLLPKIKNLIGIFETKSNISEIRFLPLEFRLPAVVRSRRTEAGPLVFFVRMRPLPPNYTQ